MRGWNLSSLTNNGFQGSSVDSSRILGDIISISYVKITEQYNIRVTQPTYPAISVLCDEGLKRSFRNTVNGGNQINLNISGGVRINSPDDNRVTYNI